MRIPFVVTGLVVASSACSPGYEVTVSVTEAVNKACDTSCVRSVEMVVFGESTLVGDCAEDVSMRSLRDHGLSGQFDVEAPAGPSGVWIGGYRDPGCASGPLVFDGIAAVTDDETTVPLECITSCKDQQPSITVKTTDVFAAMQGRCEVGPGTSAISGVLVSLRWDRYSPSRPFSELWGSSPTPLLAGVATFANAPVVASRPEACAAVGVITNDVRTSVACIRPGMGLCTGAGQFEVATFSAPVSPGLQGEQRSVGLFARLDAGVPKPIEGATVVIEGGAPTARVEYHNLVIGAGGVPTLVTRPERNTGPSGAFSVYSESPVTIAITSGSSTYRRTIGGGYFSNAEASTVGALIITPN